MFYIVGLGNPGDKYENTRHNIGRSLLLKITETENFVWEKNKGANALYSQGDIDGNSIELYLPETFMNNSGQSVLYLKNKHEVHAEQVIVVYDDVDLPIGDIKISQGKGDGGHNGIKSIINALDSKKFIRIRVGVASRSFFGNIKRPKGLRLSSHVLGTFKKSEKQSLENVEKIVFKALKTIIVSGVGAAMNEYNK